MKERVDTERPVFTQEGDLKPLMDDDLAAIWDERHADIEGAMAVALSGGGYRATLLSLGVLVYLVDSGLNKDVRAITSVSGGAYANALMAVRDKAFHAIGAADIGEFDSDVNSFLDRLTSTNIWVKPKVLGLGAGVAATFGVSMWLASRIRNTPLRWAARLLGGLGTVAVLDRRGDVLTKEIWDTILGPNDRSKTLACLHREHEGRSLDHIVCATNVADGRFVYFSGRFLYASELGWQTDAAPRKHLRDVSGLRKKWRRRRVNRRWSQYKDFKQIEIKRAVDASAALPIVIPPRTFPTGVFESAGMWFVPDELRLVDGGVYDNLGVQWFRTAGLMKHTARERIRDRGKKIPGYYDDVDLDQHVNQVAPPWIFMPDTLLVVNAGGELKWTQHLPFTTLPILREPIPVVSEALELLRVGKIALNAGTERRLYWLRREFRNRFERDNPPDDGAEEASGGDEASGRPSPTRDWRGTVVQIDHSPFTIPKALRTYPNPKVAERAERARKRLGRLGEDWIRRKHQNARMRAYPHKVDPEDAYSLMYHGYVSAWANLYTLLDIGDEAPRYDIAEFKQRFQWPRP